MSLRRSFVFIGLFLVVVASARPKFLAIPLLEGVRIVELSDGHERVARQAGKQGLRGPEATDPSGIVRSERQTGGEGHGEHVDYGAHTGHHGAFGWYADFPVHTHH